VAYTGLISLTQGTPDSYGDIPLIATSTQNLDPTKYYIVIQANDQTYPSNVCGSGTTCQAMVLAPNSGSETYVAKISDQAGNDVQVTSNSITLTAPQPTTTWSLSLSKTVSTKSAYHLSATVGNDTAGADTIIRIWRTSPTNPTPTEVLACYDMGTTCGFDITNQADATYSATASYQHVENIQVTSSTVSTSAPEFALDPAWSVTLSQAPSVITGGVTLTATSNQDISLVPYDIFFLDGSGTHLFSCATETTCQFDVPNTSGQTYTATISAFWDGSQFVATSDVVTIP